MNIAVLRETGDGESRVALMPESVQKLVESKASFSIESGAGLGAARTDDDYGAVGGGFGFGSVSCRIASIRVGPAFGRGRRRLRRARGCGRTSALAGRDFSRSRSRWPAD